MNALWNALVTALGPRPFRVFFFAGIGVISGLTYAAVLYATVKLFAFPVFLGSVAAFSTSIPISYFGNRLLTYKSLNPVPGEAARFFAVQVLNLCITSGVVHLVSASLHAPLYVGVFVAFICAPVVSFILFEYWVYRQRAQGDGSLAPLGTEERES